MGVHVPSSPFQKLGGPFQKLGSGCPQTWCNRNMMFTNGRLEWHSKSGKIKREIVTLTGTSSMVASLDSQSVLSCLKEGFCSAQRGHNRQGLHWSGKAPARLHRQHRRARGRSRKQSCAHQRPVKTGPCTEDETVMNLHVSVVASSAVLPSRKNLDALRAEVAAVVYRRSASLPVEQGGLGKPPPYSGVDGL